MQRSETRILTTHAGSLPRPKALLELLVKKSRREPIDAAALATTTLDATRRAVAAQIEAGIDIGNDGEQPRESFFTYLQHCLSGFGGASRRPIMRDLLRYRTFLELKAPEFSRLSVSLMNAPRAEGPVRYVDRGPLERECAAYAHVLAEQESGLPRILPDRSFARNRGLRDGGRVLREPRSLRRSDRRGPADGVRIRHLARLDPAARLP